MTKYTVGKYFFSKAIIKVVIEIDNEFAILQK